MSSLNRDAVASQPSRYDIDTIHSAAKVFGTNVDLFLYGADPLGLLLFCGDLKAARAGASKVADAHKRILARVQQGVATAYGCESHGTI